MRPNPLMAIFVGMGPGNLVLRPKPSKKRRAGPVSARSGLRRRAAEDARDLAAAVLLGLFLVGVRRDDELGLVRELFAFPEELELAFVERLALHQGLRDALDLFLLGREQLADLFVLDLDERAHFLVDLARGLLGVVLRRRAVVSAEEDLAFFA